MMLQEVDLSPYCGGGVNLTWDPKSDWVIGHWDQYTYDGEHGFPKAKDLVQNLLTKDFVEETIATQTRQKVGVSQVHVKADVLGLKNWIFEVTAGNHQFVLVTSKGTEVSAQETRDDFYNLYQVGQLTRQRGATPFTPQPYQLHQETGFTAFSVEQLNNHSALYAKPIFSIDGGVAEVPMFGIAGGNDASFNRQFEEDYLRLNDNLDALDPLGNNLEADFLRMAAINGSEFMRKTHQLRVALASRLAMIYMLTESLPDQFSMPAGDTMIDINSPDYDLKFTTLKGGLRRIHGPLEFLIELDSLHPYRNQIGRQIKTGTYPLFDRRSIIEGTELAKKILG